MGTDWLGEWDGTCACGKKEMDGLKCKYGATHQPLFRLPWGVPQKVKFPWDVQPTATQDEKNVSNPTPFTGPTTETL